MKARQAWSRLRGGDLTPARAAASVAVGLAIGVTPLWGLHLPIVLAVCLPLRLDAAVAYLAANISIPAVAPFLTLAEFEIGALLLTGHALPMSLAPAQARGAALLVKEVVVGTAIFSPCVALIGAALTFVAARILNGPPRREETDLDRSVGRVAARYASADSRAAYHYVRGKLASDPVARRVAEVAASQPPGEVLDAGCGRGQLGLLLLDLGLATRVTGFDADTKKVAIAARAAEGLAASFRVGDLREATPWEADTVLLVDVLHYLTAGEQEATLRRAARAARRRVIVRDIDPDRGWRSRLTRLQEAITTGLGYNRHARIHVLPVATLSGVLEAKGFTVEVSPCWGAMPFSNVLLVATRNE